MNSVRGALLSDTLNLSPLQMVTKVAFLCVKTKKKCKSKVSAERRRCYR